MEFDDKIRTKMAVVVSLRDMGDGTSRFFLDDVRGDQRELPISWSHDRFYTFSPALNNKQIEGMELGGDQYERIGVLLAARLLALNQKAD